MEIHFIRQNLNPTRQIFVPTSRAFAIWHMRHDPEQMSIASSLAARNKLFGIFCGYYISTYGQGGSYQMDSINVSSIVGVEKQFRCAGCSKILKTHSPMNRIDCYLETANRTIAAFVHQNNECGIRGRDFILFFASLIAPL